MVAYLSSRRCFWLLRQWAFFRALQVITSFIQLSIECRMTFVYWFIYWTKIKLKNSLQKYLNTPLWTSIFGKNLYFNHNWFNDLPVSVKINEQEYVHEGPDGRRCHHPALLPHCTLVNPCRFLCAVPYFMF